MENSSITNNGVFVAKCNECFVSITTGEFCHLCSPYMLTNKGASVSKNLSDKEFLFTVVLEAATEIMKSKRKPASTKRSKSLFIPDLKQCSSRIGYGMSNSGMVEDCNLFDTESHGDIDSNGSEYEEVESLSFEDRTGTSIHESSYLESQSKEYSFESSLAHSKAVLQSRDVDTKDLSDEVIEVLGKQVADVNEAPNARLSGESKYITTVTVQRKSKQSGFWYNVKDIAPFIIHNEAIFSIDDSGEIEGQKFVSDYSYDKVSKKMVKSENSALLVAMRTVGFDTFHIVSYVDKHTNDFITEIVEQRFVVKSKGLKSGNKFETMELPVGLAPFNYTVNKAGEVVEQTTFFQNDILDLENGIVISAIMDEEFAADLDNRLHQQGILTGRSNVTRAMMYDDMFKAELEQRKVEDLTLNYVAAKARKDVFIKPAITAEYKRKAVKKNQDLLSSTEGQLISKLIEDSYISDMEVKADVLEFLNQNKADLLLIKKIAIAHRAIRGRGFEASVYRVLEKMIAASNRRTVANQVETHVLLNIRSLNNKSILVSSLDDSEVIEIYDVAVKFRAIDDSCNIEHTVALEMKDRYMKIKGIKSPVVKPSNSVVRNVKVS